MTKRSPSSPLAIKKDVKDPRFYLDRGRVYRVANKMPEALADFTKAIELAPQSDVGYFERGKTELAQNQYDPALADLNKAIELNPNNPDAYYRRGLTQYHQKKFPEAIQDYTTAIEKNPNDLNAFNRRADIYVAHGRLRQGAARSGNGFAPEAGRSRDDAAARVREEQDRAAEHAAARRAGTAAASGPDAAADDSSYHADEYRHRGGRAVGRFLFIIILIVAEEIAEPRAVSDAAQVYRGCRSRGEKLFLTLRGRAVSLPPLFRRTRKSPMVVQIS